MKTILASLALLALLAGCAPEPKEATHDHAGCDHEAPAAKDEHTGHDHSSHAHGADLDRSPEELFAQSCEHDVRTYQCEDCRYEVGVVRLPGELIEGGLVKLTAAETLDLGSHVAFTGEIGFDETRIAHLGPRVAGLIEAVHADLGDVVRAGQALVALVSEELAEAQAAYLVSRAEARVAVATLERQRELRKASINSERELQEAGQASEATRVAVELAAQKLRRYGMTEEQVLDLAERRRSADGRLVLRAPFAGQVLDLHAAQGEQFDAGEQIILFGDTSQLWAWMDVYEPQLAVVGEAVRAGGLPVSLRVHAHGDREFVGRLDHLDGRMDERTRTVRARVVLDNDGGLLRPGMFAEAEAVLSRGGGRPALPESAVLEDEGRRFVFVHHHEDYWLRRPVDTGRRAAGRVEILAGVEPGQQVVAEGAFLLKSDVLRSKMGEGCAH